MGGHRFQTKPIYQQLCDALTERIASGEWKSGTALPNEGELAREFNVSPGTMRKALGLMEREHLLTRHPGRGTFVSDQGSGELSVRFTNVRTPDGKRVAAPVSSSTTTQGTANETERARLELREQEPVYRVRRVRTYSDRPFIVEEAVMPAALFPGLTDENDPSDRIVVLARHHGLLLSKAEERVSIGAASSEVAKLLKIDPFTPIVVLDRVLRAVDGRPVEWRIGLCDLGELLYLAEMK